MTTVSILPVATGDGETAYRATVGGRQSMGKTAGEALDAISAQLGDDGSSALIVVQHRRPDRFFTAQQQRRLAELMARWRAARDAGSTLSATVQAELDALVDAEVRAAAQRSAALANELGR